MWKYAPIFGLSQNFSCTLWEMFGCCNHVCIKSRTCFLVVHMLIRGLDWHLSILLVYNMRLFILCKKTYLYIGL